MFNNFSLSESVSHFEMISSAGVGQIVRLPREGSVSPVCC